jgi:hypothetical protein
MLGVRPEGDVRVRPRDARHLCDATRHDVGELLVLARTDHGHEIDLTRHGVDLGYAGHGGELFTDLRESAALRGDQHDRGYQLQALDVDVVERGLHDVGGFLVAHRLATLERGLK